MVKTAAVPDQLGWRDYFQMVTTTLMLGLGIYVLWQTMTVKWALAPFIFSIAMMLFGLFRIRMIYLYFKHRGKRHDT